MDRIAILMWVLILKAYSPDHEPAPTAPVVSADQLIAETNALVESIERRMPECDLAATIAADNLTRLDQRTKKLVVRCEESQEACESQLARLNEVRITTALAIALMRSEAQQCQANQAQVETWIVALSKGIDELDERLDRAIVERNARVERPNAAAKSGAVIVPDARRARLTLR